MAEAKYPVSEQYKVLEGYDIYRGSKLIIALVAVESQFGKDLRLYRWQLRGDAWKVDLARMSVRGWKFKEITAKAEELTKKYGVATRGSAEVSEAKNE